MGFWDWLPFVGDEKEQKPAEKPPAPPPLLRRQPPRLLRNQPPPLLQDRGVRTARPAPAAAPPREAPLRPGARYSPQNASRPMQRYLRELGWNSEQWKPLDQKAGALQFIEGSERDMGSHEYKLSDWQQEQAELDFGFKAPENQRLLRGDRYRTGKLTPEQMKALTPQQRNAIRFNEQLIASVEADRRLAGQEGAAPDDAYRDRVAEMFGTQGGSEMYAPNTVNLLQQMGMGRLRGQDLDEYLSLDRAFDVEELQALEPWEGAGRPVLGEYKGAGASSSRGMQNLLDQRQIQLAGKLVENALASGAAGWDEASRVGSFLGRQPAVKDIPFGYLDLETQTRGNDADMVKEQFYQAWFEYFRDPTMTTLDEFWADADRFRLTDEDLDEFFDSVYARSFDVDSIAAEGDTQLRNGAEIRNFLGMGG